MSGRIAVDDPPAPERTLQNTWRCKRPQMLRTHPKSFTIALSRINLRLAGASRNASDCSIRLKDIVSSITQKKNARQKFTFVLNDRQNKNVNDHFEQKMS